MATISPKQMKRSRLSGGVVNRTDLTIEGNQFPARVIQPILDMVADNSLEQLVDYPTLKDKTLDLIFSPHLSYTEWCKPLLSIDNSNQDIVHLDTTLVASRLKPQRKKDLRMKRQSRYQNRFDQLR